METACLPSYPRNSDIASPPGTFTAYLSCAEPAKPPKTASQPAIPIVNMLLRFIATPPVSNAASHVFHTESSPGRTRRRASCQEDATHHQNPQEEEERRDEPRVPSIRCPETAAEPRGAAQHAEHDRNNP